MLKAQFIGVFLILCSKKERKLWSQMSTSITVKVIMRLVFVWKNMEKIISGSIVFPKTQVQQDHWWKGFHLCIHVTLIFEESKNWIEGCYWLLFHGCEKMKHESDWSSSSWLSQRQFIEPLQILDEGWKKWRFGCWKDCQQHQPTFFWELYTTLEWFTKSLACELWYHLNSQVSRRVLFINWCSKCRETTLLHKL